MELLDRLNELSQCSFLHPDSAQDLREIIAEFEQAGRDAYQRGYNDGAAMVEQKIVAHNEGCVESCESQRKAKRCDGYVSRVRLCPDCPRDWMIASLSEGKR